MKQLLLKVLLMITFGKQRCAWILIFILILVNVPGLVRAQASDQTAAMVAKPVIVNPDIDFTTNKFSLMGKAGLVLTTGNTDSFNANALFDIIYRIQHVESKVSLGGFYTDVYDTQNESGEGLSAQYLYAIYRMDVYLSQLSTVYGGTGLYSDKVKGVDSAYQFFGGLSHYLLKEAGKPTTLRVSGGYNFTHENRFAPEPDDNIHSFVQGANLTHLLTPITELTLDATLLENIENLGDTRMNSDLALNFKVTKTFSMIAGWRLRFDNEPIPGFAKLDMIQDLSLGVTF